MPEKLILIVLLMGAVTYIPRMLPLVVLKKMKLPPFVNAFLQFIPYAVLGALIFPGILSSTGSASSAAVGGLVAAILAFNRVNVVLVVMGAIVGVYFFELLF